jgi:hypothetical protein
MVVVNPSSSNVIPESGTFKKITAANPYGKVRRIDSLIKNLLMPGILSSFNDETVSLTWPRNCILALFRGDDNMYIRTTNGTTSKRTKRSLRVDGGIVGRMLVNDNCHTSKEIS